MVIYLSFVRLWLPEMAKIRESLNILCTQLSEKISFTDFELKNGKNTVFLIISRNTHFSLLLRTHNFPFTSFYYGSHNILGLSLF